jgi:hypothetical protein
MMVSVLLGLCRSLLELSSVNRMNSMYWFHRATLWRCENVIASLALGGDYHAAVQMADMPALHTVVGAEDAAFVKLSALQVTERREAVRKAEKTATFMLRLATRLFEDKALATGVDR